MLDVRCTIAEFARRPARAMRSFSEGVGEIMDGCWLERFRILRRCVPGFATSYLVHRRRQAPRRPLRQRRRIFKSHIVHRTSYIGRPRLPPSYIGKRNFPRAAWRRLGLSQLKHHLTGIRWEGKRDHTYDRPRIDMGMTPSSMPYIMKLISGAKDEVNIA